MILILIVNVSISAKNEREGKKQNKTKQTKNKNKKQKTLSKGLFRQKFGDCTHLEKKVIICWVKLLGKKVGYPMAQC